MKQFCCAIFLVTFAVTITAQTTSPKREFRAAWIASVSNIDWPTSPSLTPAQQQSSYIQILNQHQLSGMNAVMVQIRPSSDALYQSALEPWSEWLTGKQGRAPSPYYDPLPFLITEAHKRKMEFHAWLNPFRAVVSTASSSVDTSHISKKHPEWLLAYSNLRILNPGLPQVREYVVRVIMDIVRRYDVDGIHFDDYFYESGTGSQDSVTYVLNGRGISTIEDWRRDNVNLFVRMCYDSIRAAKPWVKFGVSPRGIWKNDISEGGAGTAGGESYYDIFCDPINWLQNKKVDYVAPQIYWPFSRAVAPYGKLAPWWGTMAMGRHIYIGQAAYKITTTSTAEPTAWLDFNEMPNQIRLNRTLPGIFGSIYFSSKSVTNNLGGFQDSLRNNLYKYPALVPTMAWRDSVKPLPPAQLNASYTGSAITVQWNPPAKATDGDTAKYYVIYRFEAVDSADVENSKHIRKISPSDTLRYVDAGVISGKQYTYIVTSVDKLSNESDPTARVTITATGVEEKLAAVQYNYMLEQNYPNPFNPSTAVRYTLASHSLVKLQILNVLGQVVATLMDGEQSAGVQSAVWNADVSSGMYFYRMEALSTSNPEKRFVQVKKMVVLK